MGRDGSREWGRAPTLLATEHVGAPDGVRVWTPSGATRRRAAVICGGPLAAAALLLALFEPDSLAALSLLVAGAAALLSYRRGGAITTDEHGLAVSTSHGARTARWSEVRSVERVERLGGFFLKVEAPDRVEVDLAGHPEVEQLALFRLIVARAELYARDSARPGRYARWRSL